MAFLNWLAKIILIPLIKDVLMALYKKYKQHQENTERVKKNDEAAKEYDKDPTADNLNKLP